MEYLRMATGLILLDGGVDNSVSNMDRELIEADNESRVADLTSGGQLEGCGADRLRHDRGRSPSRGVSIQAEGLTRPGSRQRRGSPVRCP